MEPMLRFLQIGTEGRFVGTVGLVGVEAALEMALLLFTSQGVCDGAGGAGGVYGDAGDDAVRCGAAELRCFGAMRLFDSARTELLFGIGRNLVLGGMLLGARGNGK